MGARSAGVHRQADPFRGWSLTVLLSAKGAIHEFAAQIDERERRASVKFILVVLVVFPLLPDEDLEVLFGLNPRFVWLMVVFVSGLSFAAYVLSPVLGAKRGIALTGVLGGFVSSTATTVSMAERTAETPALYRVCTFSTVVASIVMTGVGGVVAGLVYWRAGSLGDVESEVKYPAHGGAGRPCLVLQC